jgi:hypothetical protein
VLSRSSQQDPSHAAIRDSERWHRGNDLEGVLQFLDEQRGGRATMLTPPGIGLESVVFGFFGDQQRIRGTSRSPLVALSELCDYVLRRSGSSKANVVLGSVESVVELLAAGVIEFVGIEGYQASQQRTGDRETPFLQELEELR